MFNHLEALNVERCFLLSDPPSGLRAVIVIDDLTLGPAAGGVRTWRYQSLEAAVQDAAKLARAMTVKCAVAGLDAGGGKAVVLDHLGLDRPRAFARLGRFIEELRGMFRTAGDLGTTAEDLAVMADHCSFVHTGGQNLSLSVARGVLGCARACAERQGHDGLRGLRVAVQGCGAIGAEVARALAGAGARLVIADVTMSRAEALAEEIGATVVPAAEILSTDVDILAPCAIGGVIDEAVVLALRAWAICGAANNMLSDSSMAQRLAERGVLFVPDVVSSAGAVVDGIGRTVMNLSDRGPLIDGLGRIAEQLLRESASTGMSTVTIVEGLAQQRLAAARSGNP